MPRTMKTMTASIAANLSIAHPAKYPVPDIPPVFSRRKPAKRAGGSVALRDTSAAYQRQRARLLTNEPLCRYCLASGVVTPAVVLDHVLALSLGGDNHPRNLAPACRGCNDAKAVVEQRCQRAGYGPVEAQMDGELSKWLRLAIH